MHYATVIAAMILSALGAAAGAQAESPAREPNPFPTPTWLALQLVPGWEVAVGGVEPLVGLRWQVTPLAWSWGMNRRLSGWRSVVVEPLTRHSGSLEAYFSPGVLLGESPAFTARTGLRATFPLAEHGESWSASMAVAHRFVRGADSVEVEVGTYTLYGILGLQVSRSFPDDGTGTTVTLNVRYL